MAVIPSWLRNGAGMILIAGVLGLSFGCKRGSADAAGTVHVGGTVSYSRIPVQYDGTTGKPTGFGPASTLVPARGVVVQAFQLYLEINQSGQTIPTWRLAGSTVTDLNGSYGFSGSILSGYSTFIEVDGAFQMVTGTMASVKIVSDSNGITSSQTEPNRPIWAFREDMNGTPLPNQDPTASPSNITIPYGDTTVDFNLGVNSGGDLWASTLPNWYLPGSTYTGGAAIPPVETVTMDARVLGIVDSIYLFSYWYGDPTPSQVKNGVLDLHYHPGTFTTPRRSFVVYDPTTLISPTKPLVNLAFDGTKQHWFGTLSGNPAADDAWDPGVLYPMLGRNNLYGQGKTALIPTGNRNLPSLAPDLAVVDGLGDAMAAQLLMTPFLTDTTAATGLAPLDIRDLSSIPASQLGIYSPRTAAAVGWQVIIGANFITAPGTPAQWAQMTDPNRTLRFFTLIYPNINFVTISSTVTLRTDIASLTTQLARLQEAKNGSDTADLKDIFGDAVLYSLLAPDGISWTNIANLNPYTPGWVHFAAEWSSIANKNSWNPPSLPPSLSTFTLSMGQGDPIPDAVQMANPEILNPVPLTVFPNCSQGEVAYGKLGVTVDASYALGLGVTVPSTSATTLPAGATLQVVVDGDYLNPYLFTNSNLFPSTQNLVLRGNTPPDQSNPLWHWFEIRLVSPTTLQPDLQVTVNLTKNS